MRHKPIVAALALAVLMSSSVAHAQTSTNEQMARNLFEAGRTAYESGRFDQALRYFQESYDLSQRPALLFNIASAADRLQENERAIEAYRAYLAAVPNAENRELAESRIAFLEGVLRRQRGEEPDVTPEDAAQTVVTPGQNEEPRDQPAPSGGGDVTGEWWFWTIIAVAVVGVGVGVTAGVVVATSGVEEPIPGDTRTFMALAEW